MKKNIIRLTESQLHRVIKETVKKVLKEDKRYIREWTEDDEWDDGDDLVWHVEDICSEFGDGLVVINGTLGLWNGTRTIHPTECDDIKSAIYKCIGSDGDILDPSDLYLDENGVVHLTVSHHDGKNVFTITKQ